MFHISDMTTGKRYPAILVKETKCYFIVHAATVLFSDKLIEHRFHKNTMTIEWQHLILRKGA